MTEEISMLSKASLPAPQADSLVDRHLALRDAAAHGILAAIEESANHATTSEMVGRMLRYIHAYLFDPDLDFDGMVASAQRDDLDTGAITQRFAEEVGRPPVPFVERRRLAVATRLLHRSNLRFETAAVLAGFRDLPAFLRAASRCPLSDASSMRVLSAYDASASAADFEAFLTRAGLGLLTGPQLHGLIAFLLRRFPVADQGGQLDGPRSSIDHQNQDRAREHDRSHGKADSDC